jgi:hypothetical protein
MHFMDLKRRKFEAAFCLENGYHLENSSPEIAECGKFFHTTCDELVAEP